MSVKSSCLCITVIGAKAPQLAHVKNRKNNPNISVNKTVTNDINPICWILKDVAR